MGVYVNGRIKGIDPIELEDIINHERFPVRVLPHGDLHATIKAVDKIDSSDAETFLNTLVMNGATSFTIHMVDEIDDDGSAYSYNKKKHPDHILYPWGGLVEVEV